MGNCELLNYTKNCMCFEYLSDWFDLKLFHATVPFKPTHAIASACESVIELSILIFSEWEYLNFYNNYFQLRNSHFQNLDLEKD